MSVLAIEVKVHSSTVCVTFAERQNNNKKEVERCFPQFAAWFGLGGPQQVRLGSIKASGEQAEVRFYCREMDGSGPCCGLSLALRVLSVYSQSELLWPTPVCCFAPAAGRPSFVELSSQWMNETK